MRRVERLGYVGVSASDLDGWRAFAVEVLGFEISPESTNDAVYLRFDDHHHRLAVHAGDADDVAYVGWEMSNPAQLAATATDLESRGIAVHQGTDAEFIDRCVLDLSWFVCPHTGVRSELFVGPEKLFQPAFQPSRPITGFITGEQGLGHVVLYAPDLVAAEQFYAEVLGFATSDRVLVPGIGHVAAFMHCNTRHHTLGLMGFPDTPRRMQHVMLEALDIDTVGTTYDICLERGITTTSLGRHLNDRAVSFYFQTPSGWHVEYGWGARAIDPATWQIEHYNGLRAKGEWGHDGLTSMI